MPALLERPKMSSAMARALHQHVMKERARKRQEEEEVDKMMEQKMKEEQERKRKKEMEERMSLEETKEQISKMELKLQNLQEEKHQLFLQLKKVLHEEEKRRAKMKEQSDLSTLTQAAYPQALAIHSGPHLINVQEGHGRSAGLLGDRPKSQMFTSGAIAQTRAFSGQGGFAAGQTDHPQYQAAQAGHGSYPVNQTPHGPPYGPGQAVTYASSQQLRGPSAFQAMSAYLPHQQTAYAVHGHFTPQQGRISICAPTETCISWRLPPWDPTPTSSANWIPNHGSDCSPTCIPSTQPRTALLPPVTATTPRSAASPPCYPSCVQ
ncbi:G protein pathway suppressor 2 isoform X3 [Narcine bancroftii]|uniref:G protein pathway suppressor 2 isoform X3 n=1 Tax=Narcine bancroftii TaxID=1343680 RepID=UPI0038316916